MEKENILEILAIEEHSEIKAERIIQLHKDEYCLKLTNMLFVFSIIMGLFSIGLFLYHQFGIGLMLTFVCVVNIWIGMDLWLINKRQKNKNWLKETTLIKGE